MQVLVAVALSKVFLVLLALLAVVGIIRGRLRLGLRLTPDRPSPVPTSWALSVRSGARLHRRLQMVAARMAPLAPEGRRVRRLGRRPRVSPTEGAASEALSAAVEADRALARAARLPKPDRRAAFKRVARQVEQVERLADRAEGRARADDRGVIDTSATVVSVSAPSLRP